MLAAIREIFSRDRVDFDKAIPVSRPMGDWKNEILTDCTCDEYNEPLVALGLFTEDYVDPNHPDYCPSVYCPEIFTTGIYAGERLSPYGPPKLENGKIGEAELKGSLVTSFVRKSVARKLKLANAKLPPRHAFVIMDALRTEEVQDSLYEAFKRRLMKLNPHLDEETASRMTQSYVSKPDRKNAPHMTGGAVDLTIVEFDEVSWKRLQKLTKRLKKIAPDRSRWQEVYKIEMERQQIFREHSNMLDMGVAFDEVKNDAEGRPITALRYYEEKLEREGRLSPEEMVCRENRCLLYNVLSSVGFTFWPFEPWHAEINDKPHAARMGLKKALYGYAELSPSNKAHEEMRVGHYLGTLDLSERAAPPADTKLGASALMKFVHATARLFGRMNSAGRHTMAHRILPPEPGMT